MVARLDAVVDEIDTHRTELERERAESEQRLTTRISEIMDDRRSSTERKRARSSEAMLDYFEDQGLDDLQVISALLRRKVSATHSAAQRVHLSQAAAEIEAAIGRGAR
ncbi:hypothetical protein BKG84_24880 [Mycobacteroides chelonae]|uniref:Uncharacterized protein n=1 Tax=Mycobacteroides chelonae TaxID=1774 RepID=A0A1S1LYX3_MYCCH|nr:hypothetical protein BKG84_24880 [Mycobacteroides chelonae]